MTTENNMTSTAPATSTFEEELEFAINALREEGGIELLAANAEELIEAVDDPDLTAQLLREVARLHDWRADVSSAPVNWAEMSNFAKLMRLSRYCDNDVRRMIEEIAYELRIEPMTVSDMAEYRLSTVYRDAVDLLEREAA